MPTITGPFFVELPPLEPGGAMAGLPFGRRAIAKRFEGPLEATSRGEMMTWMSPVQGSAGYVAIEWVTGTLEGRRGSFALQHSSVMRRGAPVQSVQVVPDSGTEELAGLTGQMRMVLDPGVDHHYEFEFGWEGKS